MDPGKCPRRDPSGGASSGGMASGREKEIKERRGNDLKIITRERKVTKNKGVFPNDTALEKLVFMAFTRIRRKWTQPVQNWGQTAQQLAILFPDRFRILS